MITSIPRTSIPISLTLMAIATSTLDTIIALGQSGMENLKASNNPSAYETTLAAAKVARQ